MHEGLRFDTVTAEKHHQGGRCSDERAPGRMVGAGVGVGRAVGVPSGGGGGGGGARHCVGGAKAASCFQ